MKLLFISLILILLQNCSFDKNSGIWKDKSQTADKKKKIFEGFVDLNSEQKIFNQIIDSGQNLKLFSKPKVFSKLNDQTLDEINNVNFDYQELNFQFLKSKKLSKNKIQENIFFDNNNLIFSDNKGNIVVYSVEEEKILRRFNFYKKKYKSFNKNLNLLIKDNIIYAADNIGFIYAYNYNENKVMWAHRHKIPYRSNIKIYKKNIIISDQDNNLYILDQNTGKQIKKIPTEQVNFNNNFRNNIIVGEKRFFFLNSYGSLYSFDEKMNVDWFINLNKRIKENPSNIFYSNQILISKKNILILTNDQFYIIDKSRGVIVFKKNFGSNITPLLFKDHLFLVNANDLFIAFSLEKKKVIYSFDLKKKFKSNSKLRKISNKIKNLKIVNNSIYLFLEDHYIVKINFNSEIEEVFNIKSNLNSNPIFINNSLLFLNNKNKLIILN